MLLFRRLRDDEWVKRSNTKTSGKAFSSLFLGLTWYEIRTADLTFFTSASSGLRSGTGSEFTTGLLVLVI